MPARSFEPHFWTRTTLIQIGYGMWANQVSVAVGLAFSFASIVHAELNLESGGIKVDEDPWTANILPLAAPIGCLISGFLVDKYGRRFILRLCPLPMALGWFLVCGPDNMALHIIGRIIKAIGVGMALVITRIYTSEISLPKVRLINGAVATICISLGIIIMSLMHFTMSWIAAGILCGTYTISIAMANHFLPETPHSLLLKGRNMERVKKNIRLFRSSVYKQKALVERTHLKLFREKLEIERLSLRNKLKKIIRSGVAHWHFLIVMLYAIAGQMFGAIEIVFWTVDIIKAGYYREPPAMINGIIAAIRILAALLAAVIYYNTRRRPVAIYSAVSLGISYLALGICLSNTDSTGFASKLIYVMVIISSTVGYYTLPFLMLTELVPLQIRGLLVGFGMSIWCLSLCFSNICFSRLNDFMGYSRACLMFGLMSFICAMLLRTCLPETKDMSLPEIEERFYYTGTPGESAAIHHALYLLDGGYKPVKSSILQERRHTSLLSTLTGQSNSMRVVKFDDKPTIIEPPPKSKQNLLDDLGLTAQDEKE